MGKVYVALFALAVVFAVCVAIAGAIFLATYLEAKADMISRPREPMDWCSKHGFFRMKHALPVPGVPTVRMCPTCFLNSLRASEKEPTIEVKK